MVQRQGLLDEFSQADRIDYFPGILLGKMLILFVRSPSS